MKKLDSKQHKETPEEELNDDSAVSGPSVAV